jgi:hypothetical protein
MLSFNSQVYDLSPSLLTGFLWLVQLHHILMEVLLTYEHLCLSRIHLMVSCDLMLAVPCVVKLEQLVSNLLGADTSCHLSSCYWLS